MEFLSRIFVKFPSIKRCGNPPSRSRTDTYGQTDRDGRTARHDEANEPFSLFLRTRLIKNKLLLYYTAWQLRFLLCALASPSFPHGTTPPPPPSQLPFVTQFTQPTEHRVFVQEVSFELHTATSINDHYRSLYFMLKLILSCVRITAQSVQ